MKILHYTLGFQPYRTGGLVKYSTDLMKEQSKQGHLVYALYPAIQYFFGEKVRIRETKSRDNEIKLFELVNSLPIALFGGIKEPSDFMVSCDQDIYTKFLSELKPDIIHIHTLMGIHKEFFEVAKELKIKIFFSSHDYYGLSPIPTFFYNGVSYDNNDDDNERWNIMSSSAFSYKKLRIFQNKLYPLIRGLVKVIKNIKVQENKKNISNISAYKNYLPLIEYYKEVFSKVDYFLFNSNLAMEVYTKNLEFNKEQNLKVLSITNSSIKHRDSINTISEKFRIAYIGPDEEYKGYYEFIKWAEKLDLHKFYISTYGHLKNNHCPINIKQYGKFSHKNIEEIYKNIDCVIVPSLWLETFGFVTLEALSFNKVVFVSKNVGAKDLLNNYFIFNNINEINEDKLFGGIYAKERPNIKHISEHAREITKIYSEGF